MWTLPRTPTPRLARSVRSSEQVAERELAYSEFLACARIRIVEELVDLQPFGATEECVVTIESEGRLEEQRVERVLRLGLLSAVGGMMHVETPGEHRLSVVPVTDLPASRRRNGGFGAPLPGGRRECSRGEEVPP